MCANDNITVTFQDLRRLLPLVGISSATMLLEHELQRATFVDQLLVPPDVVTMNSVVVYEDRATGVRKTVRLVYPDEADPSRGWISVHTPLGSALLGLKTGQVFCWDQASGPTSIILVEVQYQPEASGNLSR